MKSICIKTVSEEKIEYLLEKLEELPINMYISNYRFKTYENLIIHYTESEYIDEFYEAISVVIKKCIEHFYEEELINKNVEKNYFYLSAIERKYIEEITRKILELPDEKKKIVLEGFVNFRIKKYKELLEKIVEVSVFSYLDLITF